VHWRDIDERPATLTVFRCGVTYGAMHRLQERYLVGGRNARHPVEQMSQILAAAGGLPPNHPTVNGYMQSRRWSHLQQLLKEMTLRHHNVVYCFDLS
jgi:hypothetical protein